LKSSRSRYLLTAAFGMFVLGLSARGELGKWIQTLEAKSSTEQSFFRAMWTPGGSVFGLRPPREVRPDLEKAVAAAPANADLLSLQALEDEQQLDFAAAETHWKKYAELNKDRAAGYSALADFYGRRLRPQEQIAALDEVAKQPPTAQEKLLSAAEQGAWRALTSIFEVIQAHALPGTVSREQYKLWMARYPKEQYAYSSYFNFLLDQKDFNSAQQFIGDYQKAFPDDESFIVKARATIAYRQGAIEKGLAEYDRNFQPLWPAELVQNYFELLKQTRSLKTFLDDTRAAIAKRPDELDPAVRLFYYYQQQGKLDGAQAALADFRVRREADKVPWKSSELYTLAKLSEGVQDYDEAARYYYALYNSQGDKEAPQKALAGIVNILLSAPEQPIRIGAGDLSMYSDIARMDRYPGFLNGILSLILNTTGPKYELANQEAAAVPYFHRAEASQLLTLLDSKFPNAPQRAELHAKLLDAYNHYGETDVLIREAKAYLAAFPNGQDRSRVALLLADGYARKEMTTEEFATYDDLLKELAAQADNVPLGAKYALGAHNDESTEQAQFTPYQRNCAPRGGGDTDNSEANQEPTDQGEGEGEAEPDNSGPPPADCQGDWLGRKHVREGVFSVRQGPKITYGPRSPEYARVLDRYIARLVSLKKTTQALALYRRELDRNPDDPGLYERMAEFLDQNKVTTELEETYKRAMQRFQDRSWHHKLARWYLREKRESDYERLTREVTQVFSGTDLEQYFQQAGPNEQFLSLRLNEFANQRFPHDLVFVRNLLALYRPYPQNPTADPVKWEALLRQEWYYDDGLRGQFFEFLSSTGKLNQELQAARGVNEAAPAGKLDELVGNSPAAAKFLAEGESWRSHFEQAAPVFQQLAASFPGDIELDRRASSILRSLAPSQPKDRDAAVAIELNLQKLEPWNRDTLARIGDIYADADLYEKASPYWKQMVTTEPGKPESYLESATVFWDYYMFDDAARAIEDARRKIGNSTLYAWEMGAIYEGKRDFDRAVLEYVRGALGTIGEPPDPSCTGLCVQGEYLTVRPPNFALSESRLLQLATRPAQKQRVEQATSARINGDNPDIEAVDLRIAVLQAQNRRDDIEKLLEGLVTKATSFDLLDDIQTIAQQQKLEKVREHALEKQATLTSDPVERLRLRFDLVRLYESNKETDAAQHNLEAIYKERPNILGVVRTAVDFYWRNKMQPQALDVLERSIAIAQPPYKAQFMFETAGKANQMGQYGKARELLTALLQQSPYDASYIAAMAATYPRQGDDQGLRDFYTQKIQLFRQAKDLSDDAKKVQIAGLRRGLIPALTRLKDYAGAVDQYIEIINRFPEDAQVVSEAALYAQDHDRRQQLSDYYAKTAAASPRGYMWPMIQARIFTSFEDFPAAIESYARAIAIRPDRTEFYQSRASLEERLMKFDDAVRDYEKIYDLDYHNQRWMLQIAEVRARQGQADAVIAALQKALIEGRPERAENSFEVARHLEEWNMLAPARRFAEQGMRQAGDDLLVESQYAAGAQTYASILTKQRDHALAFARLQKSYQTVLAMPAPKVEHQQAVSAATEAELEKEAKERRNAGARSALEQALHQLAATVDKYYTPEERSGFATFLAAQRPAMSLDEMESVLIPLAQAASLAELEVRWRSEAMLRHARSHPREYSPHLARVVELQRRRMKYNELGGHLERYNSLLLADYRGNVAETAAEAYRSAENSDAELRVLAARYPSLSGNLTTRYFDLLMARQPQTLVAYAGDCHGQCTTAANYAIGSGDLALALQALQAHGQARTPAWNKAYTALTGLYYSSPAPNINGAFQDLLGTTTIGERLGKPVDRNQQLAGGTWYYYGSRYGDYLSVTKLGDPEDYLPSMLEDRPGDPQAYFDLARFYEESGNAPRAIADYEHALDLEPARSSAQNRMAIVLWKQGKHAEAVEHWKSAIAILNTQMNSSQVPETFWTNMRLVINELSTRKLIAEMRQDVDGLLRAYLKRNGSYRALPLLRAGYDAAGDPAKGVAWLLDMATATENQTELLTQIVNAGWVPAEQRERLFDRILELATAEASKAQGNAAKEYQQSIVRDWQLRWVENLITTKQYERAQQVVETLASEGSDDQKQQLVPVELRLAAFTGGLDALLDSYSSDTSKMPTPETLRAAASALSAAGDRVSAQKVLEVVFNREIEQHNLNAANLLGLAEIRLDRNDLPGAMTLLRRMTLVVGDPFQNHEAAAALLERKGHSAEAAQFRSELVKAVPWDMEAKERLAESQAAGADTSIGLKSLAEAAGNSAASYKTRIAASIAFAKLRGTNDVPFKSGSGELDLLSSKSAIDPVATEKPFYYEARLKAVGASTAPEVRVRVLRGALEYFPFADAARIPLFQAAMQQSKYQIAVNSLEPLTENGALAAVRDDSQPAATSAEDATVPRGINLDQQQRAQVVATLARAFEKLERYDQAVTEYQQAIRLEKTAATKSELRKSLNAVKTILNRRKLNSSRQPMVHSELEQTNVVRPRLQVPQSASPARVTPARARAAAPAETRRTQ
jgi:cellulose synthase operon protein C